MRDFKPHFRFAAATVLAALFCLCFPATAQNTIHIPADQPTIQAGISAAANGDTVLVAPGTYFENIDFLGKAITVTSSGGAASTIIDGGGKGSTVTFKTNEPRAAILSNLTITHGSTNDLLLYSGGGVKISNSMPTLLNNVITRNFCQNVSSQNAAPLIQGNIVSSSLTPENCSVLYTGGIHLSGPTPPAGTGSPAIIMGNTIENNTTGQLGDGGGDGGAGIAIFGGNPLIQGNIIRNNITRSGNGGGIDVVFGTGISIIQNLIYGNSAGCGGGAIGSEQGSVSPDTYLLIANNTIVDDSGGVGGGYSDCRKTSEIWTAFYTGGGPSIKFVNNIFQANFTPALDCGSMNSSPGDGVQSLFDHNLLYNTAGPFFASNCIDLSHLHGNLVADPQFVNLAQNDFHLRSTSHAIDAGNGSVLANLKALSGTDLPKDFDGNPREVDATGLGRPIIDMGAYEFSGVQDATPTRIVISSSAVNGPASSNCTLTATLSSALGVPTGMVSFFLDNQLIGTGPINGGIATLSGVTLTPGTHLLYATYDGQAAFQPATSVYFVVNLDRYATTLLLKNAPSPSIIGQTVLFSVHASSSDSAYMPSPIQLVDLSGKALLATLTPDASGNASFSTATLSLGLHSIDASSVEDTLHAGGFTTVTQQVISGYTTNLGLSSSPNPSSSAQPVTFTAHVTSTNGTPAGTVQFTDGTNGVLTTVPLDPSGNASFTTSSLSVGTHPIAATYNPTGGYAGSTSSLSQVVNGLPAKAVLSANPLTIQVGDSVTLSAAVTATTAPGTPTGSVAFYDNGLLLGGSPLTSSGTASLITSSLTTGTNSLTCNYSGDVVYSPAPCTTVAVTARAADTAIALTSSGSPAAALSLITFTATLTSSGKPNSSGTHFYLDGKLLVGGIAGPAGTTSIQLSLPSGVHIVTAEFSGAAGLNGSSATLSETLVPNPTSTTLSPPSGPVYQNQQFSLSSIVLPLTGSAQPYGTVTLHDGTAVLATQIVAASQSSPSVPFNVPPLSQGTHLLFAVYAPADGNFLASTSSVATITVLPQTFNFAGAPSISVQTEHHTSMQLTLASIGGWTGPVNLTCAAPLPPVLTCGLAKGVNLAPNNSITTTLTIDTDAVLDFKSSLQEDRLPRSPRTQPFAAFAGLLLPLACLGFRGAARRPLHKLFVILCALASLQALTGCSGKYPDHTPPGTYNITLLASGTASGASAPTSATLQVKLVVTP